MATNIDSELLAVIERSSQNSKRGRRAMGIMVLGCVVAVYGLATGETQVFYGGVTAAVLAMGFLGHYTGEIKKDNLLLKAAANRMG